MLPLSGMPSALYQTEVSAAQQRKLDELRQSFQELAIDGSIVIRDKMGFMTKASIFKILNAFNLAIKLGAVCKIKLAKLTGSVEHMKS